jgi:hypothetical protein
MIRLLSACLTKGPRGDLEPLADLVVAMQAEAVAVREQEAVNRRVRERYELKTARQGVFHSERHPSHLVLPVSPR